MEEVPSVSSENRDKWGISPNKQGHEEYSRRGVKPNWPQLNSLCSYTRLILVQKIQFGFSSSTDGDYFSSPNLEDVFGSIHGIMHGSDPGS